MSKWIIIIVILCSCNKHKNLGTDEVKTDLRGIWYEIKHDSCDYLIWRQTITHKGNCKNNFHKRGNK